MGMAAVNHDVPEPPSVIVSRPAHPADQEQAGLFVEILQSELDELEALAGRMRERRSYRSDRSDLRLQHDLRPLNARINEVRQLIGALQDRFPAM
jgi:hypothetical protein